MRPAYCRRALTHADVLAALALLLLVSTVSLAQLARAQETANRIACAQNLHRMGQALLLYSNENRGAYPRGRWDLNANAHPKPVWGTPYGDAALIPPDEPEFAANPFVADEPKDENEKALLKYRPAVNDVTAALFLLLRTQDIPAQTFICPTAQLDPWDYGGGRRAAKHWNNWAGSEGLRNHLSYSYQNPYPSRDAIGKGFKLNNAISAEFTVASDMNPGGEALLKLTSKQGMREQRQGNSYNHDRDGQNMLYGDGHVEWFNNAFAGVKRDNVFTFGESGTTAPDKGGDGIVGPPVGPNDSVLLPTARDIGQVDERGDFVGAPKWTKPTAEQAEALRERLAGEYEQVAPNGAGAAAVLRVTKEQLVATSGPITITFGYTIDGIDGAHARLALAAPQTKDESARLQLAPDGDLVITKSSYYAGQWKRRK